VIRIYALGLMLLLTAACGGGGGGGTPAGGAGSVTVSSSSSSSSSTSSAPALTNLVAVTIDGGPPQLSGRTANVPYVDVTICVPNTQICQTIDHVTLDTGSVGLRIQREAIDPALLQGLPALNDAATSTPLAQCYQYVDGYVWGSVKAADFTIGGESVRAMPLMVIADQGAYATVPPPCSSAGGTFRNSIQTFGAKGILGIGTTTVDCGTGCAIGTALAPRYYRCGSTNCTMPTTVATVNQIPNPVARFAVNNNGSVLELPRPSGLGARVLNGTLYFGIGTQANNQLGSATVIPLDSRSYFTATYKGQALTKSFLDSGTNLFGFKDDAIAQCTGDLAGFFCAGQALTLSATISGGSATVPVSFTLNDTNALQQSGNTALVGLGGDPGKFTGLTPLTDTFDFGLPFYFGRRVYTGMGGGQVQTGSQTITGPFVAF
jgi:Protein of unknown function (DUF3443)